MRSEFDYLLDIIDNLIIYLDIVGCEIENIQIKVCNLKDKYGNTNSTTK